MAKLIPLHLFDYYCTLFQNRIQSRLFEIQRVDANVHRTLLGIDLYVQNRV